MNRWLKLVIWQSLILCKRVQHIEQWNIHLISLTLLLWFCIDWLPFEIVCCQIRHRETECDGTEHCSYPNNGDHGEHVLNDEPNNESDDLVVSGACAVSNQTVTTGSMMLTYLFDMRCPTKSYLSVCMLWYCQWQTTGGILNCIGYLRLNSCFK